MKSSKTSFLRNCISGWNVRPGFGIEEFAFVKIFALLCSLIAVLDQMMLMAGAESITEIS